MPVRIRLSRGGAKKKPFYRIVVAEALSPRDGKFIERLGSYNPMVEKENAERLVLNTEGKVTPLGPQGRVKTDNKGNFEFLGVEPDYRSAYQLGTRLDGKLYSTKIFFFKLFFYFRTIKF